MDYKAERQKATEDGVLNHIVELNKMAGWIVAYLLLYLVTPPARPLTCDIIYYGHGSMYGGVQAFINKDTFVALVRFGFHNHTGKEYGGNNAVLFDSPSVFIPGY